MIPLSSLCTLVHSSIATSSATSYVHNLGMSILVHYNNAQAVHSLCMHASFSCCGDHRTTMISTRLAIMHGRLALENVTWLEKHLFYSIPFHRSIPFLSFLEGLFRLFVVLVHLVIPHPFFIHDIIHDIIHANCCITLIG